MSQEWYCTMGGKKYGPLSPAKLKEMAAAGRLSPSDLVWREGLDNWVPARTLKGLFATPPVTAFLPEPREPADAVGGPDFTDHKDCPFCGEPVLTMAKRCKHCGETLDVALRAAEEAKRFAGHSGHGRGSAPRPAWNTIRPLLVLGTVLMALGALATLGFFTMDTTVEVPVTELFGKRNGGGRVHNIGLMHQQQNGIIISLAVCGLGLVLAIVGLRK